MNKLTARCTCKNAQRRNQGVLVLAVFVQDRVPVLKGVCIYIILIHCVVSV